MLLGPLENDKMLVRMASPEMVVTTNLLHIRDPGKSLRPIKTQMMRTSLTPRTKERGRRLMQVVL